MTIFDLTYTFDSKSDAEAFCKRIRDMAYKCDVVVLNDICKDRGEPMTAQGYRYGYNRKECKKLKSQKDGNVWKVVFPAPGKMVRDEHGYWTTEDIRLGDAIDKGGG